MELFFSYEVTGALYSKKLIKLHNMIKDLPCDHRSASFNNIPQRVILKLHGLCSSTKGAGNLQMLWTLDEKQGKVSCKFRLLDVVFLLKA